jgi:hypothetical protein
MSIQVINGTGIGVNDLLHILWTRLCLHPGRSDGYQALGVELVRICEVPDQRLGIVGLVGDVR